MKKIMIILAIMLFFFAGCKRDDVIEASKVKIEKEDVEYGWNYLKVNVEYSYPVTLKSVNIRISEKEDMSDVIVSPCELDGYCFTAKAEGLKDETKYYYHYEYDDSYDKSYGEVCDFTTLVKPLVQTEDVMNVTASSAIINGSVISTGEGTILARGFCWGEHANTTLDDNYSNNGDGLGVYSQMLTDLNENTTYYFRAYATTEKGTEYAEEKTFTTKQGVNGYEYIDLGLPSGLKWATCNIGATLPGEYGEYYSWGELVTKTSYDSDNCSTYGKRMNDISGDIQYDVARKEWGGTWRIPTKDEQHELIDNCTWELASQDGGVGYKVTGPNGSYIFLPAAGYYHGTSLYDMKTYGYYWSSTPYDGSSNYTYGIRFGNDGYSVEFYNRYGGRNVRAVTD